MLKRLTIDRNNLGIISREIIIKGIIIIIITIGVENIEGRMGKNLRMF